MLRKGAGFVFKGNDFAVYPAGASANRTDWQRQNYGFYPSVFLDKMFYVSSIFLDEGHGGYKKQTPAVAAEAQSKLVKRRDGSTVAPWDSAAAKASLGLECSERNMLPIHVGQEIMLRVPPSPPSQSSLPHPGVCLCLSASQQGSLHLSLYPSAISFFVFLSIFLWFFETNSLPPPPFHARGTCTAWWRFPPLRTSRS